jgi:hypothetical protein
LGLSHRRLLRSLAVRALSVAERYDAVKDNDSQL